MMRRLFRPRSVAVVGGGAWCANVIRELQRIGYQGAIWPVHPTRAGVGGLPAAAALPDLPAAPDAAFIGVNRQASIAAVRDLAQMGAGGAVCFASGFREAAAELADGAALQDALVKAAGAMPILGPNCYGFLNLLDRTAIWPDQHGAVPVDRGVAIVTQSSNVAINLTMQRRGLPLAYMVTAGNQAQTGLAQIGSALLADPRVTVLGLHIEGIGDLQNFETLAATAHSLGKPIVALKVGASDQARAATLSHTASMAGSDAGARALLARLGVRQVDSLSVLIETLKLLHVTGPLPSRRIGSMSCSGGEASLMADTGLAQGVRFPALNTRQTAGLRAALGPKVSLSNPLDYHTYIWGDQGAMRDCFRAMADPDLALSCVVLDFPRRDRCKDDEWRMVTAAMLEARAAGPMALIASLPENMPEDIAQDCLAHGVAPLCGLPEALAAIAAAGPLGEAAGQAPLWLPGPAPAAFHDLSEAEAKASLRAHGVRIPRHLRAASPEDAAQMAAQLGFPVVLKAEGFAHKTEAGAVVLNLETPDEVLAAAARMKAPFYLVEEMIRGTLAELLIGVTRDPAHGWLLTLAAGGTLTELLRDSTTLLLPVTPVDIEAALQRLKIWPLLQGWRGAPPADLAAIIAQVLAVQDYVRAHPDLYEVEMNPLLCLADRAIAADALIRKGKP